LSDFLTICHYIVWFAVFSFLGWIFECSLNIVREGTWENRGFLYGPICPIYGAGAALFMLAFDNAYVTSGQFPIWGVFLASMAGSAVLEYSTSVAMERIFGARWWDYSNMPLNLNGRICLPASLLFGAGGVCTVLFLIPLAHLAASYIPDYAWELAAILLTVIISVDTTLSFVALTEILEKVEQASETFDRVMDSGVQGAQLAAHNTASKISSAASQVSSAAAQVSSTAARARVTFQLLNALTLGRITNFTSNQQKISQSAVAFVESLNKRQQRVLASIKKFGTSKSTEFGTMARQALHKANLRTSKMHSESSEHTGAQSDTTSITAYETMHENGNHE
jgi:uncharacterized membrane protein